MSREEDNIEETQAQKKDDGVAGRKVFRERLTLITTILALFSMIVTISITLGDVVDDLWTVRIISFGSYLVIVIMTVWYYLSKESRDKKWRDASIIALCVITAGYFFWVGTWTKVDTPDQWCTEHGLKISLPLTGSNVGERVEVWGTFEKVPLESEILLVHESPGGLGYWPSEPVEIDPTTKTWSGVVYISGDPPLDANILIAKIGKPVGILYDYYLLVSPIVSEWIPIKNLKEVITTCDTVSVSRAK